MHIKEPMAYSCMKSITFLYQGPPSQENFKKRDGYSRTYGNYCTHSFLFFALLGKVLNQIGT